MNESSTFVTPMRTVTEHTSQYTASALATQGIRKNI